MELVLLKTKYYVILSYMWYTYTLCTFFFFVINFSSRSYGIFKNINRKNCRICLYIGARYYIDLLEIIHIVFDSKTEINKEMALNDLRKRDSLENVEKMFFFLQMKKTLTSNFSSPNRIQFKLFRKYCWKKLLEK